MKTSYFLVRSGGLAVLLLAFMASQVSVASAFSDGVTALVEDYPLSAGTIADIEDTGISEKWTQDISKNADGGVVLKNMGVPADLQSPPEDVPNIRGIVPLEIRTANSSNAWTHLIFKDGWIKYRLVQRGSVNAQFSGLNRAVFSQSENGDLEQLFVVGASGVEEFVKMPTNILPGGGVLPLTLTYEIRVSDGWVVSPSPTDLAVYTQDGWMVSQLTAPWAQDINGETGEPAFSWDVENSELTLSLDVNAEGMSGDILWDPQWLGYSTDGRYQYKHCVDSASMQCAVENGESHSAQWSQVYSPAGASNRFDMTFTPGTVFRSLVELDEWTYLNDHAIWAYNPVGAMTVTRLRVTGYQQDPPGKFRCYVRLAGQSQVYQSSNGAFDLAQNDSSGSGQTYAYFGMMNESGTYKWTSGTAPSCYMNNGAFATVQIRDAAVPTTPTDIQFPVWAKPNTVQTVTYDATDPTDSGLYEHQVKVGSTEQTETIAGYCNLAANEYSAQPCPTSVNNASAQFTTPATNGTYTVQVKVRDFSGRQSSASSIGNAIIVDGTAPATPVWVSDGDASIDSDGFTASNEWHATWSKIKDTGGSGIARYEYCVSSTTNSSGCTGTPEISWTSVGNTTLVDVTSGLTLTNGTTYYTCVRAVDKAGNYSISALCSDGMFYDNSPPNAPTSVKDFSVEFDKDATADGFEVAGSWQVPNPDGETGESGLSSSFACVSTNSTGNDCNSTAFEPWSENDASMTEYTFDGLTLTSATDYFFCVRLDDQAGNSSSTSCSDGFELDTDTPTSPSGVIDGSGTDQDWLNYKEGFDLTWNASTDNTSTVVEYQVCLSESSTGIDCGQDAVQVWIGIDAASTSYEFDAEGLMVDSVTYYGCVQAVDDAGNQSTSACSDGSKLAGVLDGSTFDLDWNTSSSSIEANWSTRLDAASSTTVAEYKYCVTQSSGGADCTSGADITWTTAGTNLSVTAYASLSEGTEYFVCVESFDTGATSIDLACSSGQTLDSVAPSTPTNVYDGEEIGVDHDETNGVYDATANWTASTDSTSGIAGYKICNIETTGTCLSADFYSIGLNTIGQAKVERDLGGNNKSCVKAIDNAGNASGVTCSDGSDATANQDEIDIATENRQAFGLNSDVTTVTTMWESPPTGYTWVLGIPVTTAEKAIVDAAEAKVEILLEEVSDYLDNHDDDWGDLEVDYTSGGSIEVSISQNFSTHETNLTDSQSTYVTYPEAVTVGQSELNHHELDNKLVEISSQMPNLEEQGVSAHSVGLSETNEATVFVEGLATNLPDNKTADIAINDLESSDGIQLETVVEVPSVPAVHTRDANGRIGYWPYGLIEKFSRTADTEELHAGDLLFMMGAASGKEFPKTHPDPQTSFGKCTSNGTAKIGTIYYLITALHCGDGYSKVGVQSRELYNAKRYIINSSGITGKRYKMYDWNGDGKKEKVWYDAGLMKLKSGWQGDKVIFCAPCGDGFSGGIQEILGIWPIKNSQGMYKSIPARKMRVCYSGMWTEATNPDRGINCAELKNARYVHTLTGYGPSMPFWSIKTGIRACSGNSGGPLFRSYGTQLMGIASSASGASIGKRSMLGKSNDCWRNSTYTPVGEYLNKVSGADIYLG